MTEVLDPEDLFRRAEETLQATRPVDPQRDLLMLLEFSKAMNAQTELSPLLDHALGLLVEATGAERGVLLAGETSQAPDSTLSFSSPLSVVAASFRGEGEDHQVSQGIAREVLRTGQPFHSDSLASDPRVELMRSVHAQGLLWAVAVPLRIERRVIGVFYADSRQPGQRLLPEALPFVEALAEHAAIAIERARLLEAARERERSRREVEELRRLDERKSQFIHHLAHEVGNPLTALIGYARRLQGTGDPKQEKAARIVREEAERLRRLVDDLLDLARARATPPPARATFALWESVERSRSQVAGAEEDAVACAGADVQLSGAADDFLRVLGNLLGNAMKHGARRARVGWSPAASGMVEIAVEDDGPGIAETERDRVFEEFWRGAGADPSTSHGLGLSIVKALVERHGGKVRVGDSALGGAGFRFTWPGAGASSS